MFQNEIDPDNFHERTPVSELSIAVLCQAGLDCRARSRKLRIEAINFLTKDSPLLKLYTGAAGIDPEWLQDRLRGIGRTEAAKEQPRKKDESGKTVFDSQVVPQVVATPEQEDDKNKTSTEKALASKTNRGAVERMDRLAKHRPDLARSEAAKEQHAASTPRHGETMVVPQVVGTPKQEGDKNKTSTEKAKA